MKNLDYNQGSIVNKLNTNQKTVFNLYYYYKGYSFYDALNMARGIN